MVETLMQICCRFVYKSFMLYSKAELSLDRQSLDLWYLDLLILNPFQMQEII